MLIQELIQRKQDSSCGEGQAAEASGPGVMLLELADNQVS